LFLLVVTSTSRMRQCSTLSRCPVSGVHFSVPFFESPPHFEALSRFLLSDDQSNSFGRNLDRRRVTVTHVNGRIPVN
jgi:hypothetical protein